VVLLGETCLATGSGAPHQQSSTLRSPSPGTAHAHGLAASPGAEPVVLGRDATEKSRSLETEHSWDGWDGWGQVGTGGEKGK